MRFAVLASGSSGNAFVVENKDKIYLFDAGISCKQIFLRMERLGLNPEKLDSIFISHEHSDHIRGVDVLAKKTDAEIYISRKTFLNSSLQLDPEKINFFKPDEMIKKQNLEINLIKKKHDSIEPVSFFIQSNRNLGILTDIGSPCNNVIDAVKNSDSLILESNHDVYMLKNGKYPPILQKRILSDFGHLSNTQSSLLTLEHAKRRLHNLVLGHLSLNNNTETLAYNNMASTIKHRKFFFPNLYVSNRERPSSLFRV